MKGLIWLVILAGAIAAGSWAYRFAVKPTPAPLPQVAATIYPLYDLVRQVAGDSLEVILLTPPGTDPHLPVTSLHPTFAIGQGLDSATSPILVDKNRILIPGNPYYYLSLKNAIGITETVRDELSARFPENQDIFKDNAQELIIQIEALDQQATAWATASGSETLTAPAPWAYTAADYGKQLSIASGSATLDPYGGSIDKDTYLNLMESNLKELFSTR